MMIMITVSINAQVGMFDLEYQLPLARAEAMLKSKGFTFSTQDEISKTYTNSSIPNLLNISLIHEENEYDLAGWAVIYTIENQDQIGEIIDQLVAIHNSEPYYDPDIMELSWEFDEDRYMITTLTDSGHLIILYVDDAYPGLFF